MQAGAEGWPGGNLHIRKHTVNVEGYIARKSEFNFELAIVIFLETQVVLVPSANTGNETYKKFMCLYVPGVQLRVRNGRGRTGVYYRRAKT